MDDFDRVGFIWYLDPTYLDCSPGNYDEELSENDHRELSHRIGNLSGFVALSTFVGPKTLEIYDRPGLWDEVIDWERKSTAATLATGTNGHELLLDRSVKTERLWIRKPR